MVKVRDDCPKVPEVEVWGIHHPTIGFRFRGVCVSTDVDDAIAWANAENIVEGTDKWKARKFLLSVNQPAINLEDRPFYECPHCGGDIAGAGHLVSCINARV